jgi:hypothetical protein
MRKSRVLLAGVAVAAAGAATSAFTASNTFTVDNNVAGYGEMVASGVTVTNVAYAPATNDATKLHSVTFTVDKDTTSMSARMTLLSGASTVADVSNPDCTSTATTITCTLTTDLLFTAFTKTGLTVTSN